MMVVPRAATSAGPTENSPLPADSQRQPSLSPALRLSTSTRSATMKAA